MRLNLQTLPHLNIGTAIANHSHDRLEFIARCSCELEDVVPFQFGDE